MEITTIVIGGIAGFIAGQANGYFERKNARKMALRKAFCELLEIRHRFKGSMYIFKRFLSEEIFTVVNYNEVISNLPENLLWDKQISERYNAAIDLLSPHAPVSAFLLRSKDIVGILSNGNLIKHIDNQETLNYFRSMLETAEEPMTREIDFSIQQIASLIGKKEKTWAFAYIAETQEPPPEAKKLFDALCTAIQVTTVHSA